VLVGKKPSKIAVIGNGLMGTGISQVFAAAGDDVTVIGRDRGRLEVTLQNIAKGLHQLAGRNILSASEVQKALERTRVSTSVDAAKLCEMVIEVVSEDIPLKREIFAALDAVCSASCILASSSGQPVSALIDRVKRPARCIATHFWYPAPLIPIVEVCPGPMTEPVVVAKTIEVLRSVGKEPVELKWELPGLIGNRIQFAILREAWALWASGVASAEAIDTVVKKTLGRRLAITGPIESAELGGLDTLHSFAVSLMPHLNSDGIPAKAVTALVEGGARGVANKRGIYDWCARDGERLRAERVEELLRWLEKDAR
jgi:3-hydroxybutyryl-CoA dehydrogenase